MEKCEFESGKVSEPIALFGISGPSRFWSKEKKS